MTNSAKVKERTNMSETPQVGAWYKCKDYSPTKKMLGKEVADYLRTPRRASWVCNQDAILSTLGDTEKAIGIDGKPTNTPRYHINWLIKVKDPDNWHGKKFTIDPRWRRYCIEQERRGRLLPNHASSNVIGENLRTSHESFSGLSLWLWRPNGTIVLVPKHYLNAVPEIKVKVKKKLMYNPHTHSVSATPGSMLRIDDTRLVGLEKRIGELVSSIHDLKGRINDLESEDVVEDLNNNLDNSMIVDLPPQIAEWAKQAGIGIEDMIQLSKELSVVGSTTQIHKDLTIMKTRMVEEQQETEREKINDVRMCCVEVSRLRHETARVFAKWGSTAVTISYLAHTLVNMFV